jgi:hypothetical protein
MRRYARGLALFCLTGLASCAQWLGLGDLTAVDDAVIVARVNSCENGPRAANDYMQVGFANVYAACEAFFVSATRFQQNALATSNTLDAGLVGASSILNATTSTAVALKAITITTAGVVFGKTVLNDYMTIYTFGTHLYKVRQLVQNDMDNYTTQVAAPQNTCIAYANVQKFATKCTLANMQALLDAQVAIPSQTVAGGAGGTGSPGAAGAHMMMLRGMPVRSMPASASPPISSTVIPVH